MRHFDEGQWADFTRGIQPEEDVRIAMGQHLDKSCEECVGALWVWESVREKAQNEKTYVPPMDLVRQAKGIAVLLTSRPKTSVVAQLAQLVFDSFTQPLKAGVRGATMNDRQLLYRAGNVAIDLRVEVKPGEVPVFLFGQILQEGHMERGEQLVEVSLLEGTQTLGRTTTNELGEFEMHVPVLPGLVLSLQQQSGKNILIPLSAVEPRGRTKNSD
jgi:hypothetical protein